jgi:hypothetical protein
MIENQKKFPLEKEASMHVTRIPRQLTTLSGGALVAAVLGGGAWAWASSQVVTASSVDTWVRTHANTNLSPTGAVPTTILTVQLPRSSSAPSRYVLTASGDIVNFGPSDYIRCGITIGGVEPSVPAAMVGDGSQAGAQGPGTFVMPITATDAVTLPAGTGVVNAILECHHDHTNGAAPYIDAGFAMWVHKTGSLTIGSE